MIAHYMIYRLTAMLNSNDGVKLAAEPLSRLSIPGAANELAAIQAEVEAIENSTVLGPDGAPLTDIEQRSDKLSTSIQWKVTGFNEKLLSKRYKLPTDPFYFQKFRQYLITNNFRYIYIYI